MMKRIFMLVVAVLCSHLIYAQTLEAQVSGYTYNNYGQASTSSLAEGAAVKVDIASETIELIGFTGEILDFTGSFSTFSIIQTRNAGLKNPVYVCDRNIVFMFNLTGRSLMISKTDQPPQQYSIRFFDVRFEE